MAGLTLGGEEKRSAQDGTGRDGTGQLQLQRGRCMYARSPQAKYYPPSFHYRQVPGPVHRPC